MMTAPPIITTPQNFASKTRKVIASTTMAATPAARITIGQLERSRAKAPKAAAPTMTQVKRSVTARSIE